jgi:hypothetical protein
MVQKDTGAKRKPAGRVSAKERARRASQATEATGTAQSGDDLRRQIEEAAAEGERRRREGTVGEEPITAAELRERARGELIRMPSGMVARCRRPGMLALLQAGVIPNSLMPIVEYALTAASTGKTVSEGEITSKIEAKMLPDMMTVFDLVARFIVVQPRLRPDPEGCGCGAIRDLIDPKPDHKHEWKPLPEDRWPETHPATGEELAYVGWVPEEDKQFLFNYAVGGSRDVDRFRDDLQANVVEPV